MQIQTELGGIDLKLQFTVKGTSWAGLHIHKERKMQPELNLHLFAYLLCVCVFADPD